MINKPNLDNEQVKMKRRLSMLYALLVLVICIIVALVMSMKPLNSITSERDSVPIKLFYFQGAIDTTGADLSEADELRIKSFNDNKICVSAFRTGEIDEVKAKNFVLSWLYVHYPSVDITENSIIYKNTRWRKSHEACDDAYLSNIFQYDKRMAQSDITMDNIVTNWATSGLIIFLGAINVIMVLWFISLYRNELNHYRDR
ncbi:MAG: hypothetical protein J6N72_00665 [Psychrobacter sp.]|nr:hypothetical protein [Psychrobacter sp.]